MKCIYGIVIVFLACAACCSATPATRTAAAGEPEQHVEVEREKRQTMKGARNAEPQQAEVKMFGAANGIVADGQSAIGAQLPLNMGNLQYAARYPNYGGLLFGGFGGYPTSLAPGLAGSSGGGVNYAGGTNYAGGINYAGGLGAGFPAYPNAGLDMYPGYSMYSGAGAYPGAAQVHNTGNLDSLVNLANYPGLNPALAGGQANPQFQLQAQQSQLQQQIMQPYGQLQGAYYPQIGYSPAFQGYQG